MTKYEKKIVDQNIFLSNTVTICLVFKWYICVRLSNGLVFKWWSENRTEKIMSLVQNVLQSHVILTFEYRTPILSNIQVFDIHMVTEMYSISKGFSSVQDILFFIHI